MKRITGGVLLFLAACLPSQGQLALNAGQSYTYQFSNLPLTGFVNVGAVPGGTLFLTVNAASLQPGDALLFEMFEDTTAGAPVLARTVMSNSNPLDFQGYVPTAWDDLQGSIRLTMSSGSAVVDNFTVQSIRVASPQGFNIYSSTIVPVPEPSSLVFLCGMPIAVLLWRWRQGMGC